LFMGSNLLESTIAFQTFSDSVWPQNDFNMTFTPTGNVGSYFSDQDRNDTRLEWRESLSLAPIESFGDHNLKFGTVVTHIENTGEFHANPVDIRDDSGSLVQHIDFIGGSPFDRSDLEVEIFGQDHWVLSQKLALDMGMRFERQGITETFRVAPRVGFTWLPFGKNTPIQGGWGVFFDRVPLGVYSFNNYPEQVITTYGPNGQIVDGPRLYENIIQRSDGSFLFLHSPNEAGNFAPYSTAWNGEIEHRFSHSLIVKANFLQNKSNGVVTVTPAVVEGADALALNGEGKSRYRQLELTARILWNNDKDYCNLSYVRSMAEGNINESSFYLGDFPYPIVHPDAFGTLPADLPNRFLGWGEVHLPSRFALAPMIEYRNGFPYTVVDATQQYVGTPYSQRFPNFFSADLRISKDVPVNEKYTLRFSVSGFNLTKHFNPSEVHYNTADPQFGIFFGDMKRKYRLDFDVLF
jgi:hypothetical protein